MQMFCTVQNYHLGLPMIYPSPSNTTDLLNVKDPIFFTPNKMGLTTGLK